MCTSANRETDPIEIYDFFSEQGKQATLFDAIYTSNDLHLTDTILTVRQRKELIELFPTGWGIKFKPDSPLRFNSRIETISEAPFWYNLFKNNRALLPINGFYEYKNISKKEKLKFKIKIPNEDFFFVPALLYEKDGKVFSSMVTTKPNKWMKEIHPRMLALIQKADALAFLDSDMDEAIDMCQPFDGKLEITEVIK